MGLGAGGGGGRGLAHVAFPGDRTGTNLPTVSCS